VSFFESSNGDIWDLETGEVFEPDPIDQDHADSEGE
jgi:hypothetical protein